MAQCSTYPQLRSGEESPGAVTISGIITKTSTLFTLFTRQTRLSVPAEASGAAQRQVAGVPFGLICEDRALRGRSEQECGR